jgi:hypothetical protein
VTSFRHALCHDLSNIILRATASRKIITNLQANNRLWRSETGEEISSPSCSLQANAHGKHDALQKLTASLAEGVLKQDFRHPSSRPIILVRSAAFRRRENRQGRIVRPLAYIRIAKGPRLRTGRRCTDATTYEARVMPRRSDSRMSGARRTNNSRRHMHHVSVTLATLRTGHSTRLC